jgi:hypothetical protein
MQIERPSGQTPPLKAPRRFFAEGDGEGEGEGDEMKL